VLRGAHRGRVCVRVFIRVSVPAAGAQSFGCANKGRVCVRVFIGVSVPACCERLGCTV
jgi:hypothetical protein